MNQPSHELRADFNAKTIVVYQAFSAEIAAPALQAQTFVEPFSFTRMTWIKPSFLWLMERSRWGQSKGQERSLAIRITREGFERALRLSVLTSPDKKIHQSTEQWELEMKSAPVLVQWDPERSLQGQKLMHRSLQVGLGRSQLEDYTQRWITEIRDLTALTQKLRELRRAGELNQFVNAVAFTEITQRRPRGDGGEPSL